MIAGHERRAAQVVRRSRAIPGVLALAALLFVRHHSRAQDVSTAEPVGRAPSPDPLPPGAGHLWDAGGRLSPRARGELERHLATAARRLGSPVHLFITDRLHHESAAQVAERLFVERALDGSEASNPVLLVVAVSDGAAAIATGKGNAGIIPEIDAARITRDLTAHKLALELQRPLTRAIDAIADAGEATAARRRPLSAQDDDLPPADPVPATQPTSDQPTPTPGGVTAGKPPPPDDRLPDTEPAARMPADQPGKGSRLPIAAGVAGLVLLGLALRRRRKLAADRPPPPPSLREKPRLPTTIDRTTPTTRGRRR